MSGSRMIDIVPAGLGKGVLSENLQVPEFQRSFSWEEEHVRDLFDDIAQAIKEEQKEYFLGSIVTTGSAARPQVVDGQQRLATVVILLAAMRDYFECCSETKLAAYIERTYLQDEDPYTQECAPKLVLNAEDADYFRKRVLSPASSPDRSAPPSRPSHRRIDAAAKLAKARVDDVSNAPNPTQALLSWEKFIKTSLTVSWVKAPDEANACMIFETLNDRGIVLAITDLLKNYLFGLSGDRIEEVKLQWRETLGTLEAVEAEKTEELLLAYIRHLWSAQHGVTREKFLYSEIKSRVRSPARAVEFASELGTKARLYAALLNPAADLWTTLGPRAGKYIELLIMLGMSQIRPLLLAVVDRLPKREVADALRLMVSWVVRFLVSGGAGSGTLEKYYSDAACEIYGGKIKSAKGLGRRMRRVVPSDALFQSRFATARTKTSRLARYYLWALERQVNEEHQPELVPNPDSTEVNLEHILPLNPRSGWSHFAPDDAEEYARRLGNMVLLREKLNRQAANADFATKRKHYAKSSLTLTKEAAAASSWGTTEIDQRQLRLAKLAIKAWPLD